MGEKGRAAAEQYSKLLITLTKALGHTSRQTTVEWYENPEVTRELALAWADIFPTPEQVKALQAFAKSGKKKRRAPTNPVPFAID